MRKTLVSSMAFVAAACVGMPAMAAPQTVAFHGTITSFDDPANLLDHAASVGDVFSGSFTYDPDVTSYQYYPTSHNLGTISIGDKLTLDIPADGLAYYYTSPQGKFYGVIPEAIFDYATPDLSQSCRGAGGIFLDGDSISISLSCNMFANFLNQPFPGLSFKGTGSLGEAPAVPEPTTWALMLSGFGVAGYAARRKRTFQPSASLT